MGYIKPAAFKDRMTGMHLIGSFLPERVYFKKRDKKERRKRELLKKLNQREKHEHVFIKNMHTSCSGLNRDMTAFAFCGQDSPSNSPSKQIRQVQFQRAPGNAVIPQNYR